MKNNANITALAGLTLVLAFSACETPTKPDEGILDENDPSSRRAIERVPNTYIVLFEYLGPSDEYENIGRFRITNKSDVVLWHLGYAKSRPIFGWDCETDSGNVRWPGGWCGNGLSLYDLQPDILVEFEIDKPIIECTAGRVRLTLYDSTENKAGEIYWSDRVVW